ncbi:MAG: hemolysin family protein [Candidatus Aminicenantes bacterium]|nr:hemolysin family protein [Candidatus Aminicenantes bacterium]
MVLTAALLFILCLFLSAFFAASETAFISVNPFKLRSLEAKGVKRAGLIQKVRARLDRFLTSILVGNTLVNIAAASLATFLAVSLLPEKKNQAVLLATVITTGLILLFGEIGPKTLAAYHPLKLALNLVQPLRFFLLILAPISRALAGFINFFVPTSSRSSRPDLLSEEEMKLMIMAGSDTLPKEKRQMLAAVLAITTRPIKEIMVPRPQVKAIEINCPPEKILEIILSSEFSRYPVYRGRMDNIEGILYVKDVLSYLIERRPFELKKLLHPPLFLPESASLETALREMRIRAVHLALVVDEFGSVEGIITLEDILEEIVGEIRDETDDLAEEKWLEKKEGEIYYLRGRAPIKEIREALGLEIPESREYTTLAGFLLFHFGHFPQEKETLDYGPYQFTVEKISRRHLSLIKIEPKPKKANSHENSR